jgi:hypothetical protein
MDYFYFYFYFIFKNSITRGVSHGGLGIYIIKKSILRQKEEELWKNSNISPCKNIMFK